MPVLGSRKCGDPTIWGGGGGGVNRGPLFPKLPHGYWATKEVAQMLVEAGVDKDTADSAGRTPLTEAIRQGNTQLVDLLQD